MVLAGGEAIDRRHLPAYLQEVGAAAGDGVVSLRLDGQEDLSLNDVVRDVEDALVRWAMQRAGGQQTRAAELLGLPRTTFQSKLSRIEERDGEVGPGA
ncbi:MAG: helix-turn-helix domain-containing protein [Myxococcota bacterium]